MTDEQRMAFDRDGFLVMRRLAGAGLLADMRAIALRHAADRVAPIEYEADVAYPGAPASRTAEGGDTPRRLLQAYDRHRVFARWAADGRIAAIAAQLLDSTAVYLTRNHHNCIMTKHPRYSSATGWHRDLRYWSFTRPNLISAWLALGEETKENGCISLLPGTHKEIFPRPRLDSDQFLREDSSENRALIEHAETATLAPGDVLFFHAGAFHAAGRNTTGHLKLSAVMTYYGADNAPLPNTRSAALDPVCVRKAHQG